MQSLVRMTPSVAPLAAQRRVAAFALAATLVAALAALLWPYERLASAPADAKVLPLYGSMAVLILLSAIGLAAVERSWRWLATLCVAPVVLIITATIVSWVLGFSGVFGFTIFGEPGSPPAWFPPRIAIELTIPAALMSLAIFLLTIEQLAPIAGPFAWATGALLIAAPPARFAVLAWSAAGANSIAKPVEMLLALALMLLGVALVFSRRVHSAAIDKIQVGDRSARWRALLVVAAIAATVALWYAVRSTEIRQLSSDVDFALEETARALQTGIDDSTSSADRLWQHWRALNWRVSDELFLSDARIFLRRQAATTAVAMLDSRGAVLKVAHRVPPPGSPQKSDDAVELTSPESIKPLADTAARVALLRTATANSERVRGRPMLLESGIAFTQALVPIFDESGTLLGGFWLLYRADILIDHILRDTAPDFHVHLTVADRLVYDREPHDGIYSAEQRFRRTDQRRINNTIYTIDIAPSEKIVTRALGWTPLLVLLFGWASLILLLLALYNERRVHTLYRDRERILNQSLDLICTLHSDGTIVTVNDAAQRVLGIAPQALPGRSLLEFVPAEHRERMRQEWLLPTQETQTTATPFLRADRRTIFLQAVARWSPDEQLLYCAMRDVTAEHELHTQRQHAEDTFRIGVAQAGCAVYEYQPGASSAGGRIEWVGAIRALTGYEPEEFAAGGFEGWMQLVHPDEAQHVRQILERCMETQQPHTVDYRLRRKDGVYVPVLDRGRHLTDSGLGARRMIGALIDLTAIRQQETALRRSEERYRIIASQVGAVIIERDTASGRIRAFGPVEQIFGYTKEQLESRPLTRDDTMIHPEDRPHYFAAVDEAERNLSSYYVEHRRRHRGGHYIYIAARGVVLPGVDGRAEREIIAITDITDRKNAELALQQSEERFRLAVEQSKQIVYEYSLDQELRSETRRFAGGIEAMLGYTSQEMHELYADSNFALVHPEDLHIVRNLGRVAMETHGTFQVEHRMRHKNGHYVHVESRGSLRRNERGQVIGILGLLLDISSSKSADVDRQNYTSQLRALADIAHRVSTFLSLHELLKFLATSMRTLLGTNAAAALVADSMLAPEEVIAVSYAEHYGQQRGAPSALGAPQLLLQVRSANLPQRYTAQQMADDPELSQLTQRDDLRHPLRGWLGTPLIARDGANLGLLELSDKVEGDFTESDLQVLNQLAGLASVAIENIRLYATLEDRVTARTHELEISNRELEAFSYSVSHDLRAPLRAIAGFSTILETEYGAKLDSAARRYLQRITAGVERMANLIDDLLSLARVSRAELRRESVDLTAMSKAVLKRQTERIEHRAIEVVVDAKMKAVADPRLVEVALENLIENAIKFTGTRSNARVHIGQRRVDGRPVFYVADNGVGFDTKYASNLFGVFQRLHSASDFPGTGVGLATVQRIVQRHQGRIWAEADVDRGATFYFTLANEA